MKCRIVLTLHCMVLIHFIHLNCCSTCFTEKLIIAFNVSNMYFSIFQQKGPLTTQLLDQLKSRVADKLSQPHLDLDCFQYVANQEDFFLTSTILNIVDCLLSLQRKINKALSWESPCLISKILVFWGAAVPTHWQVLTNVLSTNCQPVKCQPKYNLPTSGWIQIVHRIYLQQLNWARWCCVVHK